MGATQPRQQPSPHALLEGDAQRPLFEEHGRGALEGAEDHCQAGLFGIGGHRYVFGNGGLLGRAQGLRGCCFSSQSWRLDNLRGSERRHDPTALHALAVAPVGPTPTGHSVIPEEPTHGLLRGDERLTLKETLLPTLFLITFGSGFQGQGELAQQELRGWRPCREVIAQGLSLAVLPSALLGLVRLAMALVMVVVEPYRTW
mmetsp:Transcript_47548/g.104010  ORF Transcript_47548/g.104010 Transcript_47548/m.104010 type:complete len:201 (-) Transcript_47548:390-992(-)